MSSSNLITRNQLYYLQIKITVLRSKFTNLKSNLLSRDQIYYVELNLMSRDQIYYLHIEFSIYRICYADIEYNTLRSKFSKSRAILLNPDRIYSPHNEFTISKRI